MHSRERGHLARMDNRGPPAGRPFRASGPGGQGARAPGDASRNTGLNRRIEQAVRLLEGRLDLVHAGPAIRLVDLDNVDELGTGTSLAPAWFTPRFAVE